MLFGKNKSLACFKQNPGAGYRLLCFPCAGSGASMYRRWADALPDAEVWAANYPGRESLHSEGFAQKQAQIIEPILENLQALEDKPFVVYGHSFGSLIGFLIASALQQKGATVLGACVSARRAPQCSASIKLAELSEPEFLKELDRLGGIPEAISSNKDMMDFYLPIIKADLAMNDKILVPESQRLTCPVYLFSATDDKAASQEELAAWKYATSSRFEHKVFEGGHFFIQDSAEDFLAHLRTVLAALSQNEEEELIAF